MGLTIEGASIGYDSNAKTTTLNNIHNNCVEHTKSALRTQLDTLRTAVNACWVGQSAENFKSNMDYDVNEICKGLDDAYQSLVAAFDKAEAGLAETDQQLIQPRG